MKNPQFKLLKTTKYSDEILLPLEGQQRTVEMSAALRGPSSSNGFGELIHLRGIPLTPKPLSRVGERGADL